MTDDAARTAGKKKEKKKNSLTTLQNRQDHHFSSAGALLCMELSCWGDLFLPLHQKEAQRIDSGENPGPKKSSRALQTVSGDKAELGTQIYVFREEKF